MAKAPKPIYRPVSTRVWSDRRFLSMGDRGRLLWLFLLTCPSIPIPGLVIGGEATIAEQLGWTAAELADAFAEVAAAELNVRREGRLVWLVNAFDHQPPASPNQLKQWSRFWDDVPECALKREVWQALRIAAKSWPIIFAKGFMEPLGKPLPKPLVEPYPKPLVEGLDTQARSQALALPPAQTPSERETLPRAPARSVGTAPAYVQGAPESLSPVLNFGTQMPEAWEPSSGDDNARAADHATKRGVVVPHALAKFREQARAAGRFVVDWNAAWRAYLLTERETDAKLRESLEREQRAAAAHAARDRERDELEQSKQRAPEAEREDLARAAKAALENGFRLPAEKATT